MKFSVLIPTRNRLEFLKYAVQSVLEQDYDDWELIISDNDSEDDVFGFIKSLDEPRIKYSKTEKFLSVTDNWNRALDRSIGDYVVMLGDDDSLTRGYFTLVKKLVDTFDRPDFLYSRAYIYAYPEVMPGFPEGMLRKIGNWGLWNRPDPWLLDINIARSLVKETFNFQVSFSYNMQYALMHRPFIEKLKVKGKFFHSPYPDYYAMTLMMQKGEKILACPYPLTIIGICPKSFGFFYFNSQEDQGLAMLNNKNQQDLGELSNVVLPGTNMNTSWLLALKAVQNHILDPLNINVSRYRRMQILEFILQTITRKADLKQICEFKALLSLKEKFVFASIHFIARNLRKRNLNLAIKWIHWLRYKANSHPVYSYEEIRGKFGNISEVFQNIGTL